MKNTKIKWFLRLIAILLAVFMCAPVAAQAAAPERVELRASDYIRECHIWIEAIGGGDLEIWFEIYGVGTMDDIGSLQIYLFESTDNVSFYCVSTYTSDIYENMLRYDSNLCKDHVDYEGVSGRYYKAFIQVCARNGSGGDTIYGWTDIVRCI